MKQAVNKLAATSVKNAEFKDRAFKLFDGAGLFLHVQKSGKYWRLKYRHAKKERLLALGVYPEVSLKDARAARDEARALLDKGIDPSNHRKQIKHSRYAAASNTFEAIAREWYREVHQSAVVEEHAGRNLRRLEVHAFPHIGRRPIGEITPGELLGVLRKVEDKGHIETARRVKTLCGQVFRYGIATGRVERDITPDLRDALKVPPTKHHPAITKPEEIGPMLKALHGYPGHFATCAALKLAPLLFVRPGELRQAEWADIDLKAAEWNFTASKTGFQLVTPLPRQAVEILKEVQAVTGRGRYVFPSVRDRKRPMSNATIGAALGRLDLKDKMSAHGFRAMARTVLAEHLGFRSEYIEQQLGHSVRDTNGRAYNRTTHLEARRAMLQAWADYLDELRTGKGNVVALNRGKTA
ncbi:tyrosine-type recombinase/integrase [Marinobacter salsuginis]|uniref:tyrosine-type recombinase/integrase n=1 Tax=Marinobacter salsuginis TaxID=418719 RepID=UPI001ADF380E|nr:integrase arm-type DNA-binding domain-containing protein [Marinobacter salsuginis]QTN43090.1 integrase arm-type DNA-binding domain-containing protein [Marinobacter salsuginis]